MAIENTTNAIAIEFPPYFMNTSPATMHGLMTFVRGSARRDHPTSSIYKFLESMDKSYRVYGDADASHLRSENLYDFLNKTLDCNVHNYSDWMLDRNGTLCWYGLVNYTTKDIEKSNPERKLLSIDRARVVHGGYTLQTRHHGEGYLGWPDSYLDLPKPKKPAPNTLATPIEVQIS